MNSAESNSSTPSDVPDGSTNITDEQKARTENLADGSPSGNATTDPDQDSDTASGGEPHDDKFLSATQDLRPTQGNPDEGYNRHSPATPNIDPVKPDEVDPETGTDPDGTPTDNPSG